MLFELPPGDKHGGAANKTQASGQHLKTQGSTVFNIQVTIDLLMKLY